jgi:Mn2+/Fe2+ NRAMP family transporter
VILCSILLDIVIQLNIWRIITISGKRAQDLANSFWKGSGYLLSALIVLGGLAFNIGNMAGTGLGMEVMLGLDIRIGVVISAVVALSILIYKEAGTALDLFTKVLGLIMIALMMYIAVTSGPPVREATLHTFLPEVIDTTAIIVLVGGTVGGYISFAGAHRLLEAGIVGPQNIAAVSSSSIRAILLASSMRILLFLAALGVVASGGILEPGNPAASVFKLAGGEVGYRIFGVVLWCASITSVVGSAYTSVSFLQTFHGTLEKHRKIMIGFFILFSTGVFLVVGRPINVLIMVGALNAFILPLALGIMLLASRRRDLMGTYQHPLWMQLLGWIAVILLFVMSIKTVALDLVKLWA